MRRAPLPAEFNVKVPVTVKFVVGPMSRRSVLVDVPVLVRLAHVIVLPPVTVAVPTPLRTTEAPLRFMPPAENVALTPFAVMIAVLAGIVKFAEVLVFQEVAPPVNVMFEDPRINERTLLLVEEMTCVVTLWLFVSSVPAVSVIVAVPPVAASASCNVHLPGWLNAIPGITFPAVVIPHPTPPFVEADTNRIVDVADIESVIPADNLKEPPDASPTLIAEDVFAKVSVPVNPVQSRDLHRETAVPVVTVTAPDSAVKNTRSPASGAEAPPAPPSVAAHFAPAVASQVAVPPTQYLSVPAPPCTRGNHLPRLMSIQPGLPLRLAPISSISSPSWLMMDARLPKLARMTAPESTSVSKVSVAMDRTVTFGRDDHAARSFDAATRAQPAQRRGADLGSAFSSSVGSGRPAR